MKYDQAARSTSFTLQQFHHAPHYVIHSHIFPYYFNNLVSPIEIMHKKWYDNNNRPTLMWKQFRLLQNFTPLNATECNKIKKSSIPSNAVKCSKIPFKA
jgi:hypothetical protein